MKKIWETTISGPQLLINDVFRNSLEYIVDFFPLSNQLERILPTTNHLYHSTISFFTAVFDSSVACVGWYFLNAFQKMANHPSHLASKRSKQNILLARYTEDSDTFLVRLKEP